MQDEGAAPRVPADRLEQYQGQTVRVVGKVLDQNPGQQTARLGCGEDASIQVEVRTVPGQQYSSTFVEVMGVVVDNSVEEIGSYELGDNFDLVSYQKVLEFSQNKFKHLFSQ